MIDFNYFLLFKEIKMKKFMSIITCVIIGLILTSTCYSWGQMSSGEIQKKYYIKDYEQKDIQFDYLFLGLDDIEFQSQYKNLIDQSNILNIFTNSTYLEYEKWAKLNFIYENYFLSIALSKLVIWNCEDLIKTVKLTKKQLDDFKNLIDIFESKIPPVEIMIQSNGDKSAYLRVMKKFRKYYTTTETRGSWMRQELYEKVQKL